MKNSDIKLVISLLRPNEIEEFGLKQEKELCLKNGIGRSSLFACGLMINSGYYSKDAF